MLSILFLIPICFSSKLEPIINIYYFDDVIANPMGSKVHFIDVGQGDCSVIELPNGEVVMIDTGPEGKWNKIKTYFEFSKIPKKIDYLILTHTDSDHIGNAIEVIKNYNVKNVYIPKVYSNYEKTNNLIENTNYKVFNNKLWNNVCFEIRTKFCEENIIYNDIGVQIKDNEQEKFCLTFCSPLEDYYEDDNSYSPIIHCKIFNQKLLFMADASKEMEEQFIDNFSQEADNFFNIRVLKVGHHGSRTSTSEKFIEKIKPTFSIISCGKDNIYGHPANETINTLKYGVFRTDTDNSIMFYCNPVSNTNLASWGLYCNYENLDSVYIKVWYISFTVIILLFVVLVLPIILSKKTKVLFNKNKH